MEAVPCTQPELVHAAPWLEHIQYPVKLRLVGAGVAGEQNAATILCSSEALCVHSEFFRTLFEQGGEEFEVVIGACPVNAAIELLQHLHAVAVRKFDDTPWNAVWADLASFWLLLDLVEYYKTLIKDTVRRHFAILRSTADGVDSLTCPHSNSKNAENFIISRTSQTKMLANLKDVAREGKTPNVLQLLEMIGFVSPSSSYPLYRMDRKVFGASKSYDSRDL